MLGTVSIGSIIAGQTIARVQRWKPVPVVRRLHTGPRRRPADHHQATTTPYVELAFFMIFLGVGYGLTGPSATIVVQSSVPLADLAVGLGCRDLQRRSWAALMGVAVAGSIFTNLYQSRTWGPAVRGVRPRGGHRRRTRSTTREAQIAQLGELGGLRLPPGATRTGCRGQCTPCWRSRWGRWCARWALEEVPLRGQAQRRSSPRTVALHRPHPTTAPQVEGRYRPSREWGAGYIAGRGAGRQRHPADSRINSAIPVHIKVELAISEQC